MPSFKIFMFYGGHGLHGRSTDQGSFLMIPEDERYDLRALRVRDARHPGGPREHRRPRPTATTSRCRCTARPPRSCAPTPSWSRRTARSPGSRPTAPPRPPHSEGLAITIASYLAHETELPNINLLHLTSRKAIEAAMMMQATFPHIDFRREVTVGHLLADFHTAANLGGKVNPPLRSARGRRGALGARARRRRRLGGLRPRLLQRRDQVRRPARRRVPRQVRLRRRRVPAGRHGQRGPQARPVLQPDRRAGHAPTRPAATAWRTKGALAVGLRRRLRAGRRPAPTGSCGPRSRCRRQEYTPFEGFEHDRRGSPTRSCAASQVLADGAIVGEPVGRFVPPVRARTPSAAEPVSAAQARASVSRAPRTTARSIRRPLLVEGDRPRRRPRSARARRAPRPPAPPRSASAPR